MKNTSKNSPKKSILTKTALLAGSVIFSLLLIEAVMRLFHIEPFNLDFEIKIMTHDLNRLKLRDYYDSPEKPPGAWRLLVIGDSFTYGAGVEIPETFVKKTERMAHEEVSKRIEIWNCGFPGWDTEREVEYLENTALGYSPDMITICFYLNDATDWEEHPMIFSEWYKSMEKNNFLDKVSYLYRWLHKRLLSMKITRETTRAFKEAYFTPVDGVDRWTLCKRSLRKARNLCDQNDIPFTLMIFPILVQLNENYPFISIHERIKRFCEQFDIPVLDLLPAFQGQDAMSLRVRINDAHPNAEGHTIAAKAFYSWLKEQNYFPSGQDRIDDVLHKNRIEQGLSSSVPRNEEFVDVQ